MTGKFPTIKPLGERAILIEFDPVINPVLLDKILFLKDVMEHKMFEEEVEIINTYNSLLVIYSSPIDDFYGETSRLQKLIAGASSQVQKDFQMFYLPVCYEPEFGLDLEMISSQKDLSFLQIIELHTAPVYTVFFIGFLPGFLYLGGMEKKLQISRKKEPRLEVKKGAVGIGENQTGIYPKTSPGGWQIIGNCPLNLFNKNQDPPCKIMAGDRVKFYAVSKEEHREIQSEVEQGTFRIKSENYAG